MWLTHTRTIHHHWRMWSFSILCSQKGHLKLTKWLTFRENQHEKHLNKSEYWMLFSLQFHDVSVEVNLSGTIYGGKSNGYLKHFSQFVMTFVAICHTRWHEWAEMPKNIATFTSMYGLCMDTRQDLFWYINSGATHFSHKYGPIHMFRVRIENQL